ncbi:hypothetical protein BG015_001056 [Linnemannia schmuckeri]|uniref:Uncharacterized protein n=1 Tax=Linnemannia schmuckeri TaxID=64567 RepID=A0A9P5RSD0_9FUNG|nr:hypothetical protein BG015_001056 [Linnemannia schmuckeri]
MAMRCHGGTRYPFPFNVVADLEKMVSDKTLVKSEEALAYTKLASRCKEVLETTTLTSQSNTGLCIERQLAQPESERQVATPRNETAQSNLLSRPTT